MTQPYDKQKNCSSARPKKRLHTVKVQSKTDFIFLFFKEKNAAAEHKVLPLLQASGTHPTNSTIAMTVSDLTLQSWVSRQTKFGTERFSVLSHHRPFLLSIELFFFFFAGAM